MDKEFNINNIKVKLSKEKLQEMLKEYDKPVWEIKCNKLEDISLFKNGDIIVWLLCEEDEGVGGNLSTISRDVARAMGDLMETKDVLDSDKTGYQLFFNVAYNRWEVELSWEDTSKKHFKTEETAILAMGIINESKDMKDWIKRMSE